MHVDAYRLSSLDEVDDLDLDTSLESSVTVVEWGEDKVEGLAEDRLLVRIERPTGGDVAAGSDCVERHRRAAHRHGDAPSVRAGPASTSARCSRRRWRRDAARARHVVGGDHRGAARRDVGRRRGDRARCAVARRAAGADHRPRAARRRRRGRRPHARRRGCRSRTVHRAAGRARDRTRDGGGARADGVRRVLARRPRGGGAGHGCGRRPVRRGHRRAAQGGLPRGVRRRGRACRGARRRTARGRRGRARCRTGRRRRCVALPRRVHRPARAAARVGRRGWRRAPSRVSTPARSCSTRRRCTCGVRTRSRATRASG